MIEIIMLLWAIGIVYLSVYEIKIYKEGNRNIYHTLREKTGLSVTTLRKYIKVLNNLDISYFDTVGNFVLVGRNKINEKYKKKKYSHGRVIDPSAEASLTAPAVPPGGINEE